MNKNMQQNLLVELFTEELPPKVLKKLGDAFAHTLKSGLVNAGLAESGAEVTVFASPRRLAAAIANVRAVGADQPFSEKLMPVAVGLDKEGKATPALVKKLAAKSLAHIDVAALDRESDGKAEQLIYRGTAQGQKLEAGLQAALSEAIRTLPVPKVMSYQLADGTSTVEFVRPAHALIAMHGAAVVNVTALGLKADRVTHGHRFQGASTISLAHADEYAARLESEGGVIASFDRRREEIERQLLEAAGSQSALGAPGKYADLLDEVTALVERPTVYTGTFEAEFLSVPAECLILTMKLNQKYFPLFDANGKLSNRFLIVSNMRLDDAKNIIEGNERVVRPRLSDARFFFETDKKTTLEARVPKLANVVYHNKLGSQLQRMERVQKLAGEIAAQINADVEDAKRAAYLAKADLLTDMVGEFPELQGVIGGYYARHDGEEESVVTAIQNQYSKNSPHDESPNLIGDALLLADRIETIVGIWGIGLKPTGDKDPFALRRAALTIFSVFQQLELAAEPGARAVDLRLQRLIESAIKSFPVGLLGQSTAQEVVQFIYDRAQNSFWLTDSNVLAAVFSVYPPLNEIIERILAVEKFVNLEQSSSLAAANKRIGNILKKSETGDAKVNSALLIEPAERALFEALGKTLPVFDAAFSSQKFTDALKSLAPLKAPVDAFFDGVMVNAEDVKLRNNRLALLRDLHALMNKVADLSKLAA
jgi:glycyl-tRNA synthetase beta chain